jgi:hypothetical protein
VGLDRSSVVRPAASMIVAGCRRSPSMYSVTPSGVPVRRDLACSQHEGVVVDVRDAGVGSDGLGHLMGVLGAGHAGAHVEELPDAGLFGQEGDGAFEERPRRPRDDGSPRSPSSLSAARSARIGQAAASRGRSARAGVAGRVGYVANIVSFAHFIRLAALSG